MKIFISSHAHLASGMKSSVEFLAGKNENIFVFDAYMNQRSVTEVVEEFLSNVKDDDQVILMADLYNGSVCQALLPYSNRENVYLIAGINLSLLLELSLKENIDRRELVELIERARESMQLINVNEIENEEEEDFF